MSATEVHSPGRDASAGTVDIRLEVQIIPVSDVDRAKQFYQRLDWRLDADDAPLKGLRIVQFTLPRAPAPRSRSAPASPRPRPARPWAG